MDHRDDEDEDGEFLDDGGLHEREEAERLEKDLKSSYRKVFQPFLTR